jgi:hypothetical protein
LTENPRGKDGREIDSHSEASIEKEPNVVFDLEMKRWTSFTSEEKRWTKHHYYYYSSFATEKI